MALNSSGPISLAGTTAGQSIEIELSGNGTTTISLNDSTVRTLAGVASGQIAMPTNFYGKTNTFAFSITTNQTNVNLATLATGAGWNGTAKVVATINSGVYVYSTSTGTPALTVSGSFPNGVSLVNNGYILGCGGGGGSGAGAGSSGGTALSVSFPLSVTNNNIIGGGGGGGGSGNCQVGLNGAGQGGTGGGGTTTSGSNGSTGANNGGSGGGGGPGGSAGVAGTPGSSSPTIVGQGGGGGGGGVGASGGSGGTGFGNTPAGGSGGSAGYSVTGNSNINWLATGTRIGPIA